MTAWRMTAPTAYGQFHVISVIFGTAVAILAAWLLRSPHSTRKFNRIMFVTGALLILGELYKQMMYYVVIYDYSYDWQLLPIQLCSLPMYLCPLLPFVRSEKAHRVICTFVLDFNVMGAIAVFIDPSDIFKSYVTLTIHGVVWHLAIIFAGLMILFSGQADLTARGFLSTLPVFAGFCAAAEVLNVLLRDLGSVNYFYISPYIMSHQIVFSDIEDSLGRPAGICVYILAMMAGALLMHSLAALYQFRHKSNCMSAE